MDAEDFGRELADQVGVLLEEHYRKWMKYIGPDDRTEYVQDMGNIMVACIKLQSAMIKRGLDDD